MDEQEYKKYRAVQDLTQMTGWKVLKGRIEEEVEQSLYQLRRLERQGRTLQDIGAEHVRLAEKINGLSRVLEIVEEMKSRAERQ